MLFDLIARSHQNYIFNKFYSIQDANRNIRIRQQFQKYLSLIYIIIIISVYKQIINTLEKMSHAEQNIVKSIIYGNPIQTTYGIFRSLCSAINQKDHIDKIIFYLRNNQNFKKYNKFVYAFRLELPTNQTFITEQQREQKQKYLDGYNDDTGLQGNGQKLLNLLKKFNVRNVLVIVAIKQKDPLRDFNAQHYVQVVKCAKDLLSSLYDKVIQSKQIVQVQEQIIYQPLPTKQFNIPLQNYVPKKQKQPQNPNYVGQQFIRKIQKQSNRKQQVQIQYLNSKIQQLANKLQEVIQQFVEIQDSQIEFVIRYDKNKNVIKVFSLLAELFHLSSKQSIISQMKKQQGPSRMSNFLRSITMHAITSQTVRKMNQELMSDKKLCQQAIKKQNIICGMLMKFIQILLKSYSFARKLALIQSQLEFDEVKSESFKSENSQQSYMPTLSQKL